jgi:hypothetical protein
VGSAGIGNHPLLFRLVGSAGAVAAGGTVGLPALATARGVPEVGFPSEQQGRGRRLWCATGAAVPLEVLVVWSFVYLALRRVLDLMVLYWRSTDAK